MKLCLSCSSLYYYSSVFSLFLFVCEWNKLLVFWMVQAKPKEEELHKLYCHDYYYPTTTDTIHPPCSLSLNLFFRQCSLRIYTLSVHRAYIHVFILSKHKNSVNKQGSIHPNSAILLLFKPLSQWSFNYVATLFVVNVMANLREKEIHATVESLEWWR